MTLLEELNLANNLLMRLPSELGLLLHLELLDLNGNPLEGIAPDKQRAWVVVWNECLLDTKEGGSCSRAIQLYTIRRLNARRTTTHEKLVSRKRRMVQTAAVLDCLRRLFPDDIQAQLMRKLDAIKIRRIIIIIRREFWFADVRALSEVWDLAVSAGVSPSDESMKLMARAMTIAKDLAGAVHMKSTKELDEVVRRWKEYRKDLEVNQPAWMTAYGTHYSNGPDFEAAQRTLRQLRMKEMTKEFRLSHQKCQMRLGTELNSRLVVARNTPIYSNRKWNSILHNMMCV